MGTRGTTIKMGRERVKVVMIVLVGHCAEHFGNLALQFAQRGFVLQFLHGQQPTQHPLHFCAGWRATVEYLHHPWLSVEAGLDGRDEDTHYSILTMSVSSLVNGSAR